MSTTIDLNIRDNVRTALAPAQPVSNAGTYDLVATITNRFGGGLVTVTGIVAAPGPLTGLKISVAAVHGGTHKDRLVDADFNTPTRLLPFCTISPHLTPAGGSFQFELDLTGVAEIKLYAKSAAGATVALEIGC